METAALLHNHSSLEFYYKHVRLNVSEEGLSACSGVGGGVEMAWLVGGWMDGWVEGC